MPGALAGLAGVAVAALLFAVAPVDAVRTYLYGLGRASYVVYDVLAVPLALGSLVLATTATAVNGRVIRSSEATGHR